MISDSCDLELTSFARPRVRVQVASMFVVDGLDAVPPCLHRRILHHDFTLSSTENVAGRRDATAEGESAKSSPEAAPEPPPRPEPEPKLEGSRWEVLATSSVAEYFHTGNLNDVLSSSPWKVADESEHDDAPGEEGGDQGDASSIFDSPPEEISVSLYVDSDPENTSSVFSVPRWFSDGEVWEVRLTEPPICQLGQTERNRLHTYF